MMKRSIARRVLLTGVLIFFAAGLGGCVEEIGVPEKGTYRGAPDQQLDAETLKMLKERSRQQSFN